MLLRLERTELADHVDIEAITVILDHDAQPRLPSLSSKETGTGQHFTWFPTVYHELATLTRPPRGGQAPRWAGGSILLT